VTTGTGIDLRRARIGIVGGGRLGRSLAHAMAAVGYRIAVVAGRRAGSTDTLAEELRALGHARSVTAHEVPSLADVVFLAVPDDAVAALASDLPWRAGLIVVHCAGALDLGALDGVRARGALAGCLHPLQSFAREPGRDAGAARFRGIACGIEGDPGVPDALAALCRDLGATSFSLAGVDRRLYHAAAVFVSNYVVALHAAAERAWTLAGLARPQAREALAPLTLGAAAHIASLPLHAALTGPIARGDAATVARHLDALRDAPDLADLYRQLGALLLQIGLLLAPEEQAALADVLSST
jgi:predicted short-subunit dehydrogenase-like oxidoreductase (DUF2520 family)